MSARRYGEVAAQIRDLVAREGIEPGGRLMPERALSVRLDVSRSIIREAIVLLEIEGLVEVRRGSGIYLGDPGATASLPEPDDIGPFELLQARQILEAEIAGFAARMVTKADIDRMRATLEGERLSLANGDGDYAGDRAFHRQVAEATQNSVLVDMVEDLWRKREQSSIWAGLHRRIFETDYRADWLDDHQAILDALRARNERAARSAMWRHLGNVRDRLMTLSDVEDPRFDGYLFDDVPLKP
ncbi:FCD domain-containing protein [Palleronia sp. LCG004]|uniref:FCD domain-containing protein n=1 Tax=Palleronia sp. LCG004 TaxID=3079304 RepID=UPI0029430EBE|nr:FCD domain-containing protein [Palleronia sp. LCG004]WOI56565.1 FCD domain-containing protein [Palleronia sp. LCG004]